MSENQENKPLGTRTELQVAELQCPHCHHVLDKVKHVVKKVENGALMTVETAVEIVLAPGMPR
jgi:hypothetical protein